MTADTDSFDIESEIELLGDLWGTSVHITYRNHSGEWLLSNTTDEGLPVGVEDITIRGNTLEECIEKAKNRDPTRHS